MRPITRAAKGQDGRLGGQRGVRGRHGAGRVRLGHRAGDTKAHQAGNRPGAGCKPV
jgi:hypothetical protein